MVRHQVKQWTEHLPQAQLRRLVGAMTEVEKVLARRPIDNWLDQLREEFPPRPKQRMPVGERPRP